MSRADDLFQRLLNGQLNRVAEMIGSEETKELFLDYKRSADDGGGRSLHNSDRANLSKAVCGFGNSEGGVVLWGLTVAMIATAGMYPPVRDPYRIQIGSKAGWSKRPLGLLFPHMTVCAMKQYFEWATPRDLWRHIYLREATCLIRLCPIYAS